MTNVNKHELKDLGEFVQEIVETASLPIERRSGSRYVVVRTRVEPLGEPGSSNDQFFRKTASFVGEVRGRHGQVREVYMYHEPGSVNLGEDTYDPQEIGADFLDYLKSRVEGLPHGFPVTVSDGCLVVENGFSYHASRRP